MYISHIKRVLWYTRGHIPDISCEQQITALSKVHNVNNANVLEHKNVVFSLVATTHLQP
jgi:hypothetical protein